MNPCRWLKFFFLLTSAGLLWAVAGHAPHQARSKATRAEFQRMNPCPATFDGPEGGRRGPCPGYIADHVIPLACGGADAPENMQWQTLADAKAKDKTERIGCRSAK